MTVLRSAQERSYPGSVWIEMGFPAPPGRPAQWLGTEGSCPPTVEGLRRRPRRTDAGRWERGTAFAPRSAVLASSDRPSRGSLRAAQRPLQMRPGAALRPNARTADPIGPPEAKTADEIDPSGDIRSFPSTAPRFEDDPLDVRLVVGDGSPSSKRRGDRYARRVHSVNGHVRTAHPSVPCRHMRAVRRRCSRR